MTAGLCAEPKNRDLMILTSNPSRYSRPPGCWRGQQKQTLIALYGDQITYEDWEENQTPVGQAVTGILGSICSINQESGETN